VKRTRRDLNMNVLPEVMFFLPHLGGGGAEMNAVRVASALRQFGFRASFAVTRGPGRFEQFLDPDTPVITLRTGSIHSSTLRLVRAIRPLRKLIEERRPAIVCPVMEVPSIAALLATRRIANPPKVILSIQNSLIAKFATWPGILPKIHFALLKKIYPSADHVVALSSGVAREVEQFVPPLRGRISVIHNAGLPAGTAAAGVTAADARPAPGGKLIVACGRLVDQKGYPFLLRAVADVARTDEVFLSILGEGPLRQSLTELAESLGIADRVQFLGFRDEPLPYMRAADVFVLSSLWEGFGNVIVEAMAVGTAVVATDCEHGPAEVITNEVNGLLVPPADERALADALRRVLRDDELRGRLAAEGLRRGSDFSPDHVARQYAEVFTNVLGRA
jgi:glycosyltransferase involved in cell wall biosynthesis